MIHFITNSIQICKIQQQKKFIMLFSNLIVYLILYINKQYHFICFFLSFSYKFTYKIINNSRKSIKKMTTITSTQSMQPQKSLQTRASFIQQIDNDQSPIKRYMRQNNFHQYLQEEASKNQITPSKIPPNQQLKNLKQFQRKVQKQHPEQIKINEEYHGQFYEQGTLFFSPEAHLHNNKNHQNQNDNRSNNKNSVSPLIKPNSSPRMNMKKSPMFPQQMSEKKRTQYYANHTIKNGENIMESLKNFLVTQHDAKSKRSPRKPKVQNPYQVSSSIQKLHNDHRRILTQRRQQYAQKSFHNDVKQVLQPFKITNPTSIYILQKKQAKQGPKLPLYLRAAQIQRQKTQQLLEKQYIHQQMQKKKQQQQLQRYQQYLKQKYSNTRNKQKQDQFYNDLLMKEKVKNLTKQQDKLRQMKEINKEKPFVSKVSKELFKKILARDQLSTNFVERNQIYKTEYEKNRQKQKMEYNNQYCPFTPKISEASKELAKKYQQRKQKQFIGQNNMSINKEKSPRKINNYQIPTESYNQSHSVQFKRSPSACLASGRTKPTNQQKSNYNAPSSQRGFSNKSPSKNTLYQQRKSPQRQVPIYNRKDYNRRRTNSCFNMNAYKK